MSKRAVVFAYSSVGCRCLEVLLDRGVEVPLVYSHQDDPGEERWFDSVPDLARARGLTVLTPESLSGEEERVRAAAPDVIFSFYYRSLIPAPILELAPLGAFNMHGSLLPRYRGRACVNWAVLMGERETGVTLHHMTARADRGNIVGQETVPIGPNDTAHDVFLRIIPAAGTLLERCLDDILAGNAPGVPQDESQATVFGRRRPADGLIDWRKSAEEIHNLVRAVAWPFPGAFTHLGGRKLMIWRTGPIITELNVNDTPGMVLTSWPIRVQTGRGVLEITEAQWADEKGERKADGLNNRDASPFIEARSVLGEDDNGR